MASLDKMVSKQPPMNEEEMAGPKGERPSSGESASDMEQLDLEIAVKLGTKMMKEAGGMDVIKQGMESSGDPTQVISKFLVQLMMQIKEAVEQQGVELSPRIVLGRGGWVEQMLDMIEGELGLPPGFSDDAFNDVMETFKAMAQSQQQGGGQPQQPAGPTGGGLQGNMPGPMGA